MNIADLSNFGIPTTGQPRAVNHLRSDMTCARKFAEVFGVNDEDDRVALKAAQVAVVGVFKGASDDEIRKTVAEQVRAFQISLGLTPVTITTVETAPTVTEAETQAEQTQTAPDESAAPTVTEAETQAEQTQPIEAPVVAKRRPGRPPTPEHLRKPKYVPTGGKRGRKPSPPGTTQYDRCLAYALDNGYNAADVSTDRSKLAIAMNAAINVPIGSCLVYIGKILKANALPATAGDVVKSAETATEAETQAEQAAE